MSYGDRAVFDRLVQREHSMDAASGAAALIAYHEVMKSRATPSTPLPWARAASRIASGLLGVLPTVLITNSRDRSLTTPPFSKVVQADLLALSGLGATAPVRAMCGLKITAVLHGWRNGLLPERVLLLDHDVIIVRPRGMLRMLSPLQYYDFAGVMEGMSRGWDGRNPNERNDSLARAPDPAGRGWEVNSGVLAMRREASWVIELWQAEFKAGLHLYEKLTGVDQSALMWVLAHEPRARLFPMPPTYNFRAPALYSRDLERPAAFHSRTAMRSPSHSATSKAMSRLMHGVAEAVSAKIGGESIDGRGATGVAAPAPKRQPPSAVRSRAGSTRGPQHLHDSHHKKPHKHAHGH